jgi:nucleoside-diphosphate-sugar epimerase
MKAKILLTGKNGQLGDDLQHMLPRLGDVVATDREHLDLARPDEIRRVIREVRPAFIVNAAAYTAVDRAENDESAARAINTEAPAVLAEEAKKSVRPSSTTLPTTSSMGPRIHRMTNMISPIQSVSTERQNSRASKRSAIRVWIILFFVPPGCIRRTARIFY